MNNIKSIREKKHISQKQLAAAIGTSQSAIAEYESGQKTPKLETFSRIADALDTSVLALLPSDMTEYAIIPTEYEAELLAVVSFLNDAGQRKVMEYARDLLGHPDYRV